MSKNTEFETHPEYDDIIERIAELSPDKYYDFVFRHPMSFYRERAEMIGATGFDRVLDAGHGFGQWSIAMADTCGQVVGADHNRPRCDISEILIAHYKTQNLSIICEPLSNLGSVFEEQCFDMIFCWGVIMFVDRSVALPLFNSLLVPGGKLILGSVNTPERWRYKYDNGKKRGIENPNFYQTCEKGINGLYSETGPNAFSIDGSGPIAEKYGFEIEAVDYDGHIDVFGERKLLFEETVEPEHQNIELVWRKK